MRLMPAANLPDDPWPAAMRGTSLGGAHYASRHCGGSHGQFGEDPIDECSINNPRHRCQCQTRLGQCCARMDGEDLRCEACRRWCGVPIPEPLFPG